MKTYTLSYYRDVIHTRIAHPPWWKFWTKATLVRETRKERVTIHDPSYFLVKSIFHYGGYVIKELMPNDGIDMVQLEEGVAPTQYVQTTQETG